MLCVMCCAVKSDRKFDCLLYCLFACVGSIAGSYLVREGFLTVIEMHWNDSQKSSQSRSSTNCKDGQQF